MYRYTRQARTLPGTRGWPTVFPIIQLVPHANLLPTVPSPYVLHYDCYYNLLSGFDLSLSCKFYILVIITVPCQY